MNDKITIDDLVTEKERRAYGIERTREDFTSASVYDVVKEDIKNMLTSRHRRSTMQRNFYDLAPATELEKSIHEVLNKKEVDIVLKRRENIIQFDFERKMQRFKKIKSKRFRRLRRRERERNATADAVKKMEECEELEEHREDDASSMESEKADEFRDLCRTENPVMTFYGQEKGDDSMSDEDEQCEDEEFAQEKAEVVAKDMPVTEEIVLPGWGVWGGHGCDVKKTKVNVIRRQVDGIRLQDRRDKGSGHVIINENQPALDSKYKVSLPHGYTKEEYAKKVKMPSSHEWTSLRVLNKFVKPKSEVRSGEIIEQFHFEPQYDD